MAASSGPGLKLGLIVIAVVTLGFAGSFIFGPEVEPPPVSDTAVQTNVLNILDDAATRRALEALQAAAPATHAQLDVAARRAHQDGADRAALSHLVLQALFGEFHNQAGAIKAADSGGYQAIIAGLSTGLRQMKANENVWCEGRQIADFLAQNDQDLVASLLAEFPYASPQYDWAMDWMVTVLSVAKQGQDAPQRYQRPGFRDEAVLQQEGLALGSEQWTLALQIAAFANAEGTSYGQMQEVIAGMDVCDLGMAVETVSSRLPGNVRARIWSDLMPEIMVGNTPYVMWRVTDYFFIG